MEKCGKRGRKYVKGRRSGKKKAKENRKKEARNGKGKEGAMLSVSESS